MGGPPYSAAAGAVSDGAGVTGAGAAGVDAGEVQPAARAKPIIVVAIAPARAGSRAPQNGHAGSSSFTWR